MSNVFRALLLTVCLAPAVLLIFLIRHHIGARDIEAITEFDLPFAAGVASWFYFASKWFGDTLD